MLRVNYINPIGYVIVTQNNDGIHRYKNDLCTGNFKLWAEIYHYIDKDGDKCSRLMMFFIDNEHLRNCVKNEYNMFLKDRHYYFNTYYKIADANTFMYLTQLRAKVSLYYKEPNAKRTSKKKA